MKIRQKHSITPLTAIVLTGLVIGLLIVGGIDTIATRALTARHIPPDHPLLVTPAPAAAAEGNRLAHIDGCFGCHGAQLTGHVVFADGLGTRLVAPNLTRLAHRRSDAQLADAIRYGIKSDGASLIDMPSNQLIKSSHGDIAAIIAYLRTLPEKPDTDGVGQLGFGGRARVALGLLPVEAALVDRSAEGPAQTPAAPPALGRYLTQAHCSACHGGDLSGKTMEGSPDLTVAIEHYSPPAFAHFFRTGEGQIGHGTRTMTRMIRSRFEYLTPAEASAIYLYLKAGALPS